MSISVQEKTQTNYKINQIATITGLSQKRIRDYEREGLIKPARDPNTNDRLFSEFDVRQIKHITQLIHKRGFTIPALKQLLAIAPGYHVFHCEEKENCEAIKNPYKVCWEIYREIDYSHYEKVCSICPIYLARTTKKIKILESPKIK
jgi:DNA-binding transcriptional MerR regulator